MIAGMDGPLFPCDRALKSQLKSSIPKDRGGLREKRKEREGERGAQIKRETERGGQREKGKERKEK